MTRNNKMIGIKLAENAPTNVTGLQPFMHYQCLRKGLIKRKKRKEGAHCETIMRQ